MFNHFKRSKYEDYWAGCLRRVKPPFPMLRNCRTPPKGPNLLETANKDDGDTNEMGLCSLGDPPQMVVSFWSPFKTIPLRPWPMKVPASAQRIRSNSALGAQNGAKQSSFSIFQVPHFYRWEGTDLPFLELGDQRDTKAILGDTQP